MEVSGVGADPLRTRRRDVVPLGLGRGEMRSCHLRTVRAASEMRREKKDIRVARSLHVVEDVARSTSNQPLGS